MEKFNFYKEYYFKELDGRNEINNSLSVPIGLISALVAGDFYLLTNFDYGFSLWQTVWFLIAIVGGIAMLIASVYNLIMAYANFPRGYEYLLIPDTEVIEQYFQELKNYYMANPNLPDTSEAEVEHFILSEMIKNTGANQKSNKSKNKFRYQCEYWLIASVIALCFLHELR